MTGLDPGTVRHYALTANLPGVFRLESGNRLALTEDFVCALIRLALGAPSSSERPAMKVRRTDRPHRPPVANRSWRDDFSAHDATADDLREFGFGGAYAE